MNLLILISALNVVATTADIYCVSQDLATSDIKVNSIVPGGMCPGHFDLSPGEANLLVSSDIVLSHGWESWIKKVKKINTEVKIKDLKADGNWMIPSIYLKGAREIYSVFKKEIEENNDQGKSQLDKNFEELEKEIKDIKTEVKKESEFFKDKKVICNVHLEEFVDSLGFEVVGTFLPGPDATINKIAGLLQNPGAGEVNLVVDNLQSGTKMGKLIAEDIGAKHVIISNFPQNNCYKETLFNNIETLKRGLIDKDGKSD